VGLTRPDQPFTVLVTGETSEGEFVPDLFQQCIVDAKGVFADTVGHPLVALEQRDHGEEQRVEMPLSLYLT
jgi:hypothetical protein